ncbi:MAG: tetratricopeptide repeat protein, partial [Candidatus Sericytochromatia bacterium]|nr:tetratricopeptide repeat protein [Candidatus Tanganyikabacteria bacterium]
RLAAFELVRRLPGLRGAERDQALFQLGQARRRLGDLAGAEEALIAIAAESAWFPKATAELAELYAIQGKTKRAIKAYQALIRTLPESEARPVRLRLGEELLATRNYEGAIDAFRPLQECDDAAMREAAWYGAGWAATRANLHSRAVWFWHQAIREFPTSARIREARLNLANHYLRMGKLGFAAEQLLAVRERNDEPSADSIAATAEFVAAEAAVQAGDWVRAIRHYKAAGQAPRWAEASAYGVGYTLWQAGQLAEAEDAFEVSLAAYPAGRMRAAARYALGRVQGDRGRPGDARKAYLTVLGSGKGRWAEEALFQLAGLDLAQDRPAEAMAWCRRLIGDYPTGRLATPGLWLLAESQLASGAISDAIESYGRLAKLPESLSFLEGRGDRVMYKLGLAYFKSGDLQSAEAAFRQVRPAVKAVGGEARFWRAETLYRLGRHGEAADLFEEVIARYPDAGKTAEAAYGLGWAELRRGRRGPAMWAFKQAAEKLLDAPMKRDAYQRLALLQLDAGSYREAQEALKQVLKLDEGGDPTEGAFYLAWSQMRAGDLEDAGRGFAALADRSPLSQRGRQARNYQGQVLLRLGKFAEAGRAFEALAAAGDWGEELDP